jgi:hypothetical protein
MIPLFIFVLSTGDIYVSSQKSDTPTGTVVATFRVSSGTALAKLGTLTGSGNSSASALALTGATLTGKENETCKTK